MHLETIYPGVYKIHLEDHAFLVTQNLTPGRTFYKEPVFEYKEKEYRSWNPTRSKLGAAIMKRLKTMPIKPKSRVLYLGVASGTSCSHVSDIVGDDGHIWALDFAPRALSDLLDKLSRFRENVSPILGDARDPGSYAMLVPKIDVIFADVAQPDQAKIAVKNADFFLKRKGWVMLSIKSRSIDVRGSPERIFNTQVMILEQGGLHVKELVQLDPFEKDHAMAVAQFI